MIGRKFPLEGSMEKNCMPFGAPLYVQYSRIVIFCTLASLLKGLFK